MLIRIKYLGFQYVLNAVLKHSPFGSGSVLWSLLLDHYCAALSRHQRNIADKDMKFNDEMWQRKLCSYITDLLHINDH